ncbi:hypothetical protein ACFX14_023663 [Malus domestica]
MTSKTLRPPLHNPQSRHLRLQYVARSCSLSSPIKQRLVDVTTSPQYHFGLAMPSVPPSLYFFSGRFCP